MTDARLVTKPPAASGLTESLCAGLYDERRLGKPIETLTVIGVLRVVGDQRRTTAKGEKAYVVMEFDHLEVLDREAGDDVDRARIMLDAARTRRHGPGAQLTLTGDDEEDRQELIRELQRWADDTGRDLDAEWSVYYDPEHVARPDKASPLQLREFAHVHGLIAESPVVDDTDAELPVEDGPLSAFQEPEPVTV